MRSIAPRFRCVLSPLCLACASLMAACSFPPPVSAPVTQAPQISVDERFQTHAARVLDEMWKEFPESAVRVGYYKYADQMSVPDQARRDRSLAFHDRQLAALALT